VVLQIDGELRAFGLEVAKADFAALRNEIDALKAQLVSCCGCLLWVGC
jgi:hypothetical protein